MKRWHIGTTWTLQGRASSDLPWGGKARHSEIYSEADPTIWSPSPHILPPAYLLGYLVVTGDCHHWWPASLSYSWIRISLPPLTCPDSCTLTSACEPTVWSADHPPQKVSSAETRRPTSAGLYPGSRPKKPVTPTQTGRVKWVWLNFTSDEGRRNK